MTDGIKWSAYARVIKYDPSTVAEITKVLKREPTGADLRWLEEHEGLKADGISEAFGNLLTTAGLNRITSLIVGGGGQALTANSRAMAGVGDGTTAAAVGDTDLSAAAGSTHRWFQAMDTPTYPTQSNGVITGNTTFGINDGNFHWQEWGWGIATAAPVASAVFATATTSGVLLNHKIQDLGTKVTNAIWTHQATITLS
jgi:hypothetical protein